jgi:hypothetical protein
LKNLNQNVRNRADDFIYQKTGAGGGHASAVSTWLSQLVMNDPNSTQASMPGPSFDTLMAQKTGKPALLMSGGAVQKAYFPDQTKYNYGPSVSFDAGGKMLFPYTVPNDVYKKMFANLVPSTGGGTAPAPTPTPGSNEGKRMKSVLDNSLADLKDLQSKLGKVDNEKLELYASTIRDIEKGLVTTGGATPTPPPATGGSCTKPPVPDASLTEDQSGTQQNYEKRMKTYFEMAAMAFACDLTRTVVIMMDCEIGPRVLNQQVPQNLVYNGASMTAEVHLGVAHYGQNDNGPAKCTTRDRYFMYLALDLISKLKSLTDPSGSKIIDNTAILGGFGVADGNHSYRSNTAPVWLAGGKNLGLHPGNSFELNGRDLSEVYFTLNQALGMGLGSIGGSNKTVAI